MRVLLIAYDNDAYMHWYPLGLGYVAAILLREGHEVEVYNQDQHHYPEDHLTAYLNRERFDMVGLSFIGGYYQYRKALKISAAINESRQRPFYVIGGHGPTPEPEFFIRKTGADVVVMGEGEVTVVELMQALDGRRSLKEVKGIAFKDGDQVRVNPRQPLIQDIDTIPFPNTDRFPMQYYRLMRMPHATNSDFVMPVLSGRGCPFFCAFCYRMDEGFRPRRTDAILEEMMLLRRNHGITYIAFHDELLMSSEARVVEVCRGLQKLGERFKWSCNGRLNYAKPDVLKLMKQAGCVFINYGIEAMDDEVLRKMNKALTTKQILRGIETTLAVGISPGFNIIFGNVGDNRETLNKGVEFLLKYDDGAQMRTIRPVTPYPGSPLYYTAIQKGRLKDCEDFYENKHVNSDLLSVNFTELTDDEFHACLCDANLRLLENYFERRQDSATDMTKKLYLERDVNFRGFRHV